MAEDTQAPAGSTDNTPATPPTPAAAVAPPEGVTPPSGDPKAPAATPAPAEEKPKDEAKPADEKEGRERNPDGTFKAKIDYTTVKLPEGSTADPALLERTVANARERGLSAEETQATVNLLTSEVTAATERVKADLMTAHAPGGAEWTKQLDAWKAQTLADPSLGKTPEERKAAIDRGAAVLKKYAAANPDDAEAMNGFLETSGLGEHPAAVRFFAWLGKSAGEKALVHGSDSSLGTRSIASRMYPNLPEE